jgi:hypothetical protein
MATQIKKVKNNGSASSGSASSTSGSSTSGSYSTNRTLASNSFTSNNNSTSISNPSVGSSNIGSNGAVSSGRDPSLFDPERELSISSKGSNNNSGRHTPEFGYPDLVSRPEPSSRLSPFPLSALKPVSTFESPSVKVYEPYTPPGDPPLPRELAEIMDEIHLANESDELAEAYMKFTPQQKRQADSEISKIIDEFSSILRPVYSKANKGYNPNFDVKTLLEEYQNKIWAVRKNILYDIQFKETVPYVSMPPENVKVKGKDIKYGNTKWTYDDPKRNADSAYTMKISKNPIFAKIRRGNDNVDERLSDIEKAYDRISEEYKAKFEKEKENIEEWGQSEKEKIVAKYDVKRNQLEQFPKPELEQDQELARIDSAENEELIRIEAKETDSILVSKLKIIEMAKDRVVVPPVEAKEVVLPTDHLYINSLIYEKIEVPFIRIGNNMNQYFKKYSERMIEGKCRKEGFIRPQSTNVISSSTGLLRSDSVIYDVIYSVDVCFPYENMEVMCKIKNITKIGIRGIINEMNNPIVLFISREHNANKHFEDYEEGQMIKVKVIGNRFELNDEYISVIGEII